MAKIFLTGATGYVGGDVLHCIVASTSSKHEISCLVRDVSKESAVRKAFPDVRVVRGDLNDTDLIEKESRNADVVFRTGFQHLYAVPLCVLNELLDLASTSHSTSAAAIVNGLSDSSRSSPGHWIQISGASLFSGPDINEGRYGQPGSKVYDDLKDVIEIRSIIAGNSKRVVDNLVLAQQPQKIKTALVVAPLIYGEGRGPLNTRSIQAPEIARITLQERQGFRLGAGLSCWSNIHIHDLSSLFVALLDAVVNRRSGLWNGDGIYLPENGRMTFGELSAHIAKEAHVQGFLSTASVDRGVNADEANSMIPHGAVLWGTNAMLVSSRARTNLGWQPSEPSLKDEIPKIVRSEAVRLGLVLAD